MEIETLTIKVRKESGENLKKILEYIKSIGNIGHSFEIVIDPGNSDHEKKFYWDGDDTDQINSIELNP